MQCCFLNLGNENFDVGHIKSLREPHLIHMQQVLYL